MIIIDPGLVKKKNAFDSMYINLHQDIRAHGTRVGILVSKMAEYAPDSMLASYGLSKKELRIAIMDGGSYHDIGKWMLSGGITKKSGCLNDVELEVFRQHPRYTEKLLLEYADVLFETKGAQQVALEMGLYHHECHDGTGYPFRFAGNEIPFTAQLCILANVLDTRMSIRKPGSRKNSFDLAAEEIMLAKDTLYSQEAVEYFEKTRDVLKELYMNNKKNWIYVNTIV